MNTPTKIPDSLRMFTLDAFDWREIAASHPAGCACLCCKRVRAERDAETGGR